MARPTGRTARGRIQRWHQRSERLHEYLARIESLCRSRAVHLIEFIEQQRAAEERPKRAEPTGVSADLDLLRNREARHA